MTKKQILALGAAVLAAVLPVFPPVRDFLVGAVCK